MTLDISDLQVTHIHVLPIRFQVNIGLSVQENKFKVDFKNGDFGSYIAFPIRTNLAIFDLQVTQILPTKFQVNWPFSSEEVQNRFPRWQPSWISDWNNFRYF